MAVRILVVAGTTAALAIGAVYSVQHPEVRAEVREKVRSVVGSVSGSRSRVVIVPAGTLITVRLDNPLSTESSRVGDVLHATVVAPVQVGGETVISEGASVQGYVAMVEAASPVTGRGHLQFKYERLRVGSGEYNLDSPSVIYDSVPGMPRDPAAGDSPLLFEPGTLLRFSLDHEIELKMDRSAPGIR